MINKMFVVVPGNCFEHAFSKLY